MTDMNAKVSAEAKSRLVKLYGLDKPWYQQYGSWLGRLSRFNFGESFRDGRPAIKKIGERLPATLLLNILSLMLILIIAIPVGVYSAIKHNSFFDRAMTVFVFIGFSVPAFWLALLMMILFGLNSAGFPFRDCIP